MLGYSLYDNVVVFDKVRENTQEASPIAACRAERAANLAVNQTLVRSINTTVVALLPIAAVLVIAFTKLGPGTLLDLALALFSVWPWCLLLDLHRDAAARHHAQPGGRRRQAREEAGGAPRPRPRPAPPSPPGRQPRLRPSSRMPGAPTTATALADDPADDVRDAATGQAPAGGTITGRQVHKYAQQGPRNQPRRQPKSKR